MELHQDKIDFDLVKHYREQKPKRICFASSHSNALRSGSDDVLAIFQIPFDKSVYPIFCKETGLGLDPSQFGGRWLRVHRKTVYNKIKGFFEKYRDVVFLRDSLALSIALSEQFEDGLQDRTPIGELEYQAKWKENKKTAEKLAAILMERVITTPYYKDVGTFCAVPPQGAKKYDLPSLIVSYIEENKSIENITLQLKWKNPKESLKNVPIDVKWKKLEQAGLNVEKGLYNKTIILIDDIYQSGTTAQYVAMKLLQAGADKVLGVALTKSMRNTDNL